MKLQSFSLWRLLGSRSEFPRINVEKGDMLQIYAVNFAKELLPFKTLNISIVGIPQDGSFARITFKDTRRIALLRYVLAPTHERLADVWELRTYTMNPQEARVGESEEKSPPYYFDSTTAFLANGNNHVKDQLRRKLFEMDTPGILQNPANVIITPFEVKV